MPALPYQEHLVVPIEWTITPVKQTMQTGALTMSGTFGIKPWIETATLSWTLPKAVALSLLNELKSGSFNQVYDYNCAVRGNIKLRPTNGAGFSETYGALNVIVTLSVEVI
jgi:hypothetical protein